jgi:hypothetical protein
MKGERVTSDAGSSVERRAGERTATVFRPVLIEAEEFAGFCLVRNLSQNGMMGKVYAQLAVDTPVTVQFNPDLVISGAVVWASNGQIGIRFDEIIDVPTVLSELRNRFVKGKPNRSPRLQIQCEGEMTVGERTLAIEVQDISQRGLKVRVSDVRPGDEILVCLKGLEPRKAVVRWTQLGIAGINFVRSLSFEQLAKWVIWHQTRMSPAGEESPDRLRGVEAVAFRASSRLSHSAFPAVGAPRCLDRQPGG